MSKKLVVVDGFGYSIDDTTISASIQLLGIPSSSCSVIGDGVCKDGFGLVLTNVVQGAFSNPAPVNASFQATAEKMDVEGLPVLREDDTTDIITVLLTNPSTGATTTVNFKVQIDSAGQNKMRCS